MHDNLCTAHSIIEEEFSQVPQPGIMSTTYDPDQVLETQQKWELRYSLSQLSRGSVHITVASAQTPPCLNNNPSCNQLQNFCVGISFAEDLCLQENQRDRTKSGSQAHRPHSWDSSQPTIGDNNLQDWVQYPSHYPNTSKSFV